MFRVPRPPEQKLLLDYEEKAKCVMYKRYFDRYYRDTYRYTSVIPFMSIIENNSVLVEDRGILCFVNTKVPMGYGFLLRRDEDKTRPFRILSTLASKSILCQVAVRLPGEMEDDLFKVNIALGI